MIVLFLIPIMLLVLVIIIQRKTIAHYREAVNNGAISLAEGMEKINRAIECHKQMREHITILEAELFLADKHIQLLKDMNANFVRIEPEETDQETP